MIEQELLKTIKKIKKITIEDVNEMEGGGIAISIQYRSELFFIFLLSVSDDSIVMNVINPISFSSTNFNGMEYEILNEFNTRTVAAKGIIADKDKKQFLFTRDEVIKNHNASKKETIESIFDFCIEVVTDCVETFEKIIEEETGGNGK